MAPLKVPTLPRACIVARPVLPEATVIGFGDVRPVATSSIESKLPLESPRVITFAFAPKAFALDWPETFPAFIVRPEVNVLAAVSVSVELVLFCITPVTFVLITDDRVTEPAPVPEFVIVPVGFIAVAPEKERLPVALFLSIRFPVPLAPLLSDMVVPEAIMVVPPEFTVRVVVCIVSGDVIEF